MVDLRQDPHRVYETTNTRDPTSMDDKSRSFAPDCRWLNSATGRLFTCRSNAQAGAVWEFIGASIPVPSSGLVYVDPSGNNATARRADSTLPFKTISAAVAAAHVGDIVMVAPGIYVENVALKAGIVIRGHSREVTSIDGNVTWASLSNIDSGEVVLLYEINVTGDVALNTSGRLGTGTTSLVLHSVTLATIHLTARAGAYDGAIYYQHNPLQPFQSSPVVQISAPDVTITNGSFTADGGRFNSITGNGDEFITLTDCDVTNGDVVLNSSATLLGNNTFFFNVHLKAAPSIFGISFLNGGEVEGTLTVDAAAQIELVNCPATTITGAGAVNRDKEVGTKTTTAGPADNDVTFGVKFIDANYKVVLTETGTAPGGIMPSVKTKAADKFTVHDTVGGRSFDWIAFHD